MPACKRGLLLALAGAAVLAALPLVHGETCLSPFVKRLNRPEKILYVYCVDVDGKDNDFLAVIDVEKGSKKFGQIVYQLDLGSKGNEPHHFGFTDDRTHIWGLTLFSNRIFLIDVATDPARPRIVKTLEGADVVKQTGLSSPHTAYALPGRMLISFLSGKDGDVAGRLRRVHQRRHVHPLLSVRPGVALRLRHRDQAGPQSHGDLGLHLLRQLQKAAGQDGLQEVRQRHHDLGLPCPQAADHAQDRRRPAGMPLVAQAGQQLRLHELRPRRFALGAGSAQRDGSYTARKLCKTGKLPVDLRQSPDDRYLFVSCFVSDEIQQWDVSDLAKPKLVHTLKPGVQPNMMHVTGDGKRMYITNSLLSTMDRTDQCWVKLAHVTPEGMKLDADFFVDLSKLKTGPARGHDMLLN